MKQFFVLFLLLCSTSVFAQDVIVKKDGSTIVCRVVELTSSEIVYKKWSDLNGSNYVMNRADASAINYQNGKKMNLSEATNLYKPNNQNDGVQQYNDRALLQIDKETHFTIPTPPKVKTLRIIGFAGGGAIMIGGLLYFLDCQGKVKGNEKVSTSDQIICYCIMGCGGLCILGCNIAANNINKKLEKRYDRYSIYQHEFRFSNGSTLTLGTDVINDRLLSNNTIGLGIRYVF